MTEAEQQKLKKAVEPGRKVVFFGGAGVSTESGIPDFRSAQGIYEKPYPHPPEQMVSHSFFLQHPQEFFRFYRAEMLFPQAIPNAAHLALAKLEQQGRLTAVITQNIDGLHQAAGSRTVLELHGSVHRNFCMQCGAFYSLDQILEQQGVPYCTCGGIIKPDVVLYEEMLDDAVLEQAVQYISQADTLIVGGTSLAVYPAAGLLRYFHGDTLVVINLSPTPADNRADLLIRERIGAVMEQL